MHFGRNNQQFDYKLDRKTLQTASTRGKGFGNNYITGFETISPMFSSIL